MPRCEEKTLKTIYNTVNQLIINKDKSAIFNVKILTSLTVQKIKKGDFNVIKCIRNSYSDNPPFLNSKNDATLLFAILSMELYYLHSSVKEFPYKNEIYKLLNNEENHGERIYYSCLLYTSPSPRDA